ncbi:dihydroneopterin aldolase [Oceanobacillus alkalisoli]|uniref:dihydroneopterin aldolase n=1 Tax=Oceanobacillus alkalisoli TaxID=2925113 RepID=UPI001EF157D5|nr:dihydroneopterin aldolase [Oceanobacillus alkalisoli]MCF3944447.1 dihydroneopterin aldolase [Oceanobacillus alkalisoli]MCG5105139.1 dihydroneopterin aldolase [Oceanobacillus alkalisoli]
MDKIILKQLQFYGYHGLFPEERKLGQRFTVDLELFLDLYQAGTTDAMEDSVHYGEVFEVVQSIVEGEPKNLIEAVAETIAARLLGNFQLLSACRVQVTKPNPPINGQYHSVAVEIYREKKE